MNNSGGGPASSSRDRLLSLLVAHLAEEKLPSQDLLGALRALLGPTEGRLSRRALLQELESQPEAAVASLGELLRSLRFRDAQRAHELRVAGRPLPEDLREELADLPLDTILPASSRRGARPGDAAELLDQALPPGDPESRAARDRVAQALDAETTRARQAVNEIASGRGSRAASVFGPRVLARAAAAAFPARVARDEQRVLLDLVLAAPIRSLAELLPSLCTEPWAQARAALLLTLRFGAPYGEDLAQWKAWLGIAELAERDEAGHVSARAAARALLEWYAGQPGVDAATITTLRRRAGLEDVQAEERPAATAPATAPPATTRPKAPPPARRRPPPVAPPPPEPVSPWREHVQGFLAENAYLAAGIVMVVVGASLLAYFTWDEHWLLRYTIMPGLLFAFTAALGRAATWLEDRDATLRDTGATLRSAAVLLLPVNFMALALLASDPAVTHKTVALPAMALVYVVAAGGLLFSWTGGVDSRLTPWLALALLALNALVLLRPLATMRPADASGLLVAGFHAAVAVVAAAIQRFTGRVLDSTLARDRRVTVFVAASLALTFLEVFVLVHGRGVVRPPLHAYAALPIVFGGLVLLVERRFLVLRGGRVGAESFLGYSLLLLGILMGAGDARMRVVAFVLAGLVWLLQARPRGEPLHHWIGLVLVLLGGASLGLLPDFPGERLGQLGVGLGVAVGVVGVVAREWAGGQLSAACRGLQPVVLVLSSLVAVLAQWHYDSEPRATALTLVVIAALLAWRAGRDESLALVHTAALLLALALPYLGFVDLGRRSLRGNTMPLGLALLAWAFIALVAARPPRLLREARSTVLFLYGVMALAAMTLRVVVEGRLAVPASLALGYREHLGPLLMAGALVVATWWSRSLLPATLASILLVILFPALKANLEASFPALGWGTGFGSALAALAMIAASFRLREAPWLRRLEGGDLLFGQAPFPFRRSDHTLFTAPLVASAVFLIVRTSTWTLARHLDHGVPLKTAAALGIAAVWWLLLATYWRARPHASVLVHPAWVSLLLGLWFANERLAVEPRAQWPLGIWVLVLLVLDVVLRRVLAARHPWVEPVLADPLRGVAHGLSLLLTLGVAAALVGGASLDNLRFLALVVAVQLARTALGQRRTGAGACLVGLGYVVLLAAAAPGRGPLAGRLGADAGLSETLAFILAVQIVQAVLEWAPAAYAWARPLVRPAQAFATGLVVVLGLFGVGDPVLGRVLSGPQQWALVAATALTARANSSGFLSLLAVVLLYLRLHGEALTVLTPPARMALLLEPLRLALSALLVAVVAVLGQRLHHVAPYLLVGLDPIRLLVSPAMPWLHAAAVLAAVLAAGRHSAIADLRHRVDQLPAPWLAAATTIVVGWFSGPYLLYWVAVVLTSLGNVHAVRLIWGEPMRGGGVSEVHLVALGLGLTLLEGTLLRLLWRHARVEAFVNRASLAVAGLVLALLTTNYAAHPDLAAMTPLRFVVSGVMALAAGLYFRRAARRPGPGEEAHVDLCEGLYHFGLASAAWCAALLVPWFRQPSTVLLALALPAVGFWLRAELETGEKRRRFRGSATVLGFLLLGLYALRPVFQMVLFPEVEIDTDHYHYYAPFAMAVGLLLLRLHGLGGTTWLAFYGGLALISGSYFATTAWPGLSPFATDPVPAAWCAIGLAHFWTVASAARSPLRGFLQQLAGLDETAWLGLRASWGRFVLLASITLAGLGIVGALARDTHDVAPLLLGAASVFLHHAVLYASRWRGQAGLLLVGLAVHADFAVESYLDREDVVWVLLGLWAAVLFVPRLFRRPLRASLLGTASGLFAALVMAQVLYHHASSDAGLVAFATGALLAALTPRDTPAPALPEEKLAAAILLLVPTWLVYFSQAPLLENPRAVFDTRAVLLTAWSLFLTGLFARGPASEWTTSLASARPLVFHHTLALAARHGTTLHLATMLVSATAAFLLQVGRYDLRLDPKDALLLFGLYAALAVAFFREGVRRRSSAPYFAAEACLVLALAVVRRQLMLAGVGWTPEHDIWASLAVSLLLAGSKQALDERPAELRRPVVLSILVLPALALVWTQVNHLGVDLALLVVGLHSLTFAYLGRERSDSPYNLVATAGFVAFVLLVFWTKLELRVLHAYVIPVGLGVLVLLQLFGRELPADTRNRIRLVTLLAMLGSAGYYALVDDRHPVAFNLTLLLLCLAAMALGSLLRIRLYLVLGLAAVLVDLASIVAKVLVRMDRGERMTSVGLLVLVLGGGLVSGAIYYKTHRDVIEERLATWRQRLGRWE